MKLSIIIPCYNVAPYVERAVRSVQEQAFADWELILVDDGSADGTLSVLRRLEASDSRIRVIAQENNGVSSARNAGLRAVRGEYVHFVDADDYLSSYGDVERWDDNDVAVYGFSMHTDKKVQTFLPPRDASSLLVRYLKGRRLHLGGFIFRRAFLEQEKIGFNEQTYYSEDKEVMIECLLYAKKVYTIGDSLYHYIRRDDSAMARPLSIRRLTGFAAMDRIVALARSHGSKEVFYAAEVNRCMDALTLYRDYSFLNVDEALKREVADKVKANFRTKIPLSLDRYTLLFYILRLMHAMSPALLRKLLSS